MALWKLGKETLALDTFHPVRSTPAPMSEPSSIPPLPENATPEEKDAHWLKYVYQGDNQAQLTVRAVVMGGLLGMLLSFSNLYTTLKIGWSFGVAITACVLSFVIWNSIRAVSGGRVSRMSLLESNCMQSTASAAGFSTGGTVGTAFAALFMYQGYHQTWVVVGALVVLTAALGVFIAIPMKRQMINHEQLPFPSGIAAAETLRSLCSHGAEALRKAYALLIGMGVGGIFGVLMNLGTVIQAFGTHWIGRAATGMSHALEKVGFKELYPFPNRAIPTKAEWAGLGYEPGVLMIGAGMIMGLRASISMLIGSIFLYYAFAPDLIAQDVAGATVAGYHKAIWETGDAVVRPYRWGVWGGTSIMIFSSLTAIALQWRTVARAFRIEKNEPSAESVALARVEVPTKWMIIGLIPISLGLVIVLNYAFKLNVFLGLLTVVLSFVLSLVACRATGETDTTPIGAMGKVTQLIYALLSKGNIPTNLISAGVTAAAAGSSADLLTDLKSGYLLGANPRRQFLAQFAGVFFGTIAVVPAWYLLAGTDVKKFTETYSLPAAGAWKAMADLLAKGVDHLHPSAIWAVGIGAVLGVGLPLLEKLLPKARNFIPSAMGLGLGMIVEFSNSLGFVVGAIIAWVWTRTHAKSADEYNIPVASGFVAGQGLVAALIIIACAVAMLMASK
jgi:OPT family oligopeptide transporter